MHHSNLLTLLTLLPLLTITNATTLLKPTITFQLLPSYTFATLDPSAAASVAVAGVDTPSFSPSSSSSPSPDTSNSSPNPNLEINTTDTDITTETAHIIHPYLHNNTNYLLARANLNPNPVKGVYVCDGPNFSGTCVWQRLIEMNCMGLPSTNDWTMGPDIGVQCRMFTEQNCQGKGTSGDTVAPGLDAATAMGIWRLPKAPVSYQCKLCAKSPQCGVPGKYIPFWTTPYCSPAFCYHSDGSGTIQDND